MSALVSGSFPHAPLSPALFAAGDASGSVHVWRAPERVSSSPQGGDQEAPWRLESTLRRALGDVAASGISFRSDLGLLAVCGGDGAGARPLLASLLSPICRPRPRCFSSGHAHTHLRRCAVLGFVARAGGGAVRLFECDGWTALGGARLDATAVGVSFPSPACRGDQGRLMVTDLLGPSATAAAELAPSPALLAATTRAVRSVAMVAPSLRRLRLCAVLRRQSNQTATTFFLA